MTRCFKNWGDMAPWAPLATPMCNSVVTQNQMKKQKVAASHSISKNIFMQIAIFFRHVISSSNVLSR